MHCPVSNTANTMSWEGFQKFTAVTILVTVTLAVWKILERWRRANRVRQLPPEIALDHLPFALEDLPRSGRTPQSVESVEATIKGMEEERQQRRRLFEPSTQLGHPPVTPNGTPFLTTRIPSPSLSV